MDAARLRRLRDIALVRAEAELRSTRLFTLRARRSGGDAVRVAVSAPRSVGSAVQRNRARRRLREAVRAELRPRASAPGTDLLIVARPALLGAPPAALREALARELAATLGQPPLAGSAAS